MGANLAAGEKVQPRELNDIKKFYGRSDSDASDDFKCKNRTCTNLCFLIFFAMFLIVLLIFLGYCMFNGDIFRTLNGYDNCGNVCGRKNVRNHEEIQDELCADPPVVSPPYHIIVKRNDSSIKDRICVDECYEGYRKFFNRCIRPRFDDKVNTFLSKTGIRDFFEEVSEDLQLCWREIIYLCLVSLGFSVLILILFRFMVGAVVWVILIGVTLACCVGTAVLWVLWDKSKKRANFDPEIDSRKTETFLALSIAATVITFLVILIIIVMRKRIQLVVQLFKEAGKALSSIPLLLLQPILTFACLVAVIALWIYFCVWIESSGFLTKKYPGVYYYKKNGWMKFTRWYNLLGMFWMCQFVIGCQHMVIAGAVSTWYFAKNKNSLSLPIFTSFRNLTRYHLGSVAMGSFLIAIVQFARVILKFVEKQLQNRKGTCVEWALKCCHCCLYCFEKVLQYLSRNAYIETAMYGYPFCQAARQAFRLLVTNALRVTAINSVGDFVLFLGKVLVVIATVLIGVKMLENKEGLQHMWIPLVLAGLFGYFVSHCFMSVYEMCIDTIFLCFCEDCEKNDGINRPYFMSRGLMQFVENSKKALEVHDSRSKHHQAWKQGSVPNISSSVA